MIVSDGVPTRNTRSLVFKNNWSHIGVKCGCHSGNGDICCVVFG